MPCIQVKTNITIPKASADAIKTGLGHAIRLIPGKSEDWLMVVMEEECRMYFGGEGNCPLAMVEVKILGDSIDQKGAGKMTEEITRILGDGLGVSPDKLYIKYEASPHWGWNGANF